MSLCFVDVNHIFIRPSNFKVISVVEHNISFLAATSRRLSHFVLLIFVPEHSLKQLEI